ncbi:hypothetical protein JCM1840_004410 [Sporobolomyces johnsonii]
MDTTGLFDAFDVADLGASLQALFREPQYIQAKVTGLESALEHLRLLLVPLLFPSSQIHLRLLYTIDATFLDSEVLPPHEIIYFQSPWAGSGRQYDLLTETIESASRLKTGARFLVFGITEHESYHEQYRFNEVTAFAALVGYHHLGKTNELAYGSRDGSRPGLLAHGYKHESTGKVIHKDILNEHVAHVFVRHICELRVYDF